jgi:hypothetical protein
MHPPLGARSTLQSKQGSLKMEDAIKCSVCYTLNPPDYTICRKCGNQLTGVKTLTSIRPYGELAALTIKIFAWLILVAMLLYTIILVDASPNELRFSTGLFYMSLSLFFSFMLFGIGVMIELLSKLYNKLNK